MVAVGSLTHYCLFYTKFGAFTFDTFLSDCAWLNVDKAKEYFLLLMSLQLVMSRVSTKIIKEQIN